MISRIVWGLLALVVGGFAAVAAVDPGRVRDVLQTAPARSVLSHVEFLKPYIPSTFAIAMEGNAAPAKGGKRGRGGGGAAPVQVAKADLTTMPVTLEGIGNVQAMSTVAVKSRIDGQLFEAQVKDGQTVKAGDLLFRLDPRQFEAQLKVAEANLARDRANLKKAEGDLARYQELARKGISPQTKFEEAAAATSTLNAAILSSQAQIDLAKLNLSYATISAPIEGRVGSVLVTPGNMIKANDTQALVVITSTKPINVAFGIPEQRLPELIRRFGEGKIKVSVSAEGWTGPPAEGELYFINNVVDTQTGTIQVMARFANEKERLIAGQFVRARAELTQLKDVVVVPSRAVQFNQKGQYVWVMKADKTVQPIPVVTGPDLNGKTAILKGVDAGAVVITDGQLRLFPGATVQPAGDADAKTPKKAKQQS